MYSTRVKVPSELAARYEFEGLLQFHAFSSRPLQL